MSRYGDGGDRRAHGPDRGAPGAGREKSELASAAERLEKAIEDLVSSATGVVSDKAADVVGDLERSARRLKDQMEEKGDGVHVGVGVHEGREGRREGRSRGRRRGRRRSEWMMDPDDWFQLHAGDADLGSGEASRANGWMRDLYREPERGWIAGVCAGLARYYQVDVWVARVVAFSLLIFIPQIAFWAYVIAIFMLARRPRVNAPTPVRKGPKAERSSAPELGPRLEPRAGVRTLRVRFRDLELRLRRMEELVTSNEFTLRRELHALETEGAKPGGTS
jgi:phage shock protein C